MINFSFSRFDRSFVRAVALNTMITAEGCALVVDPSQDNSVAPSAGTSSEQFAGISISQQISPTYLPYVEQVTVATDGSFKSTFTPTAGTISVLSGGTAFTSIGSSPTASQYTQSGTAFTTNVSNATVVLTLQYRYSPTAAQAVYAQGMVLPGGDSGAILNTVGVLLSGDVYTSEYDTSANWSASGLLVPKLAANGLFTLTGSGVTVPNCRVISRPTSVQPFLGLSIGVNG